MRPLSLLLFLLTPVFCMAQTQEDDKFAFSIDYDIPESPAFSILDANPNQVMRGSEAKPVALNILRNIVKGSQVESGLAIDVKPIFLVQKNIISNLNDYRDPNWKKQIKRVLINTQLSVATVEVEGSDNGSFNGAVGLRWSLWDKKDPLQRKSIKDKNGKGLLADLENSINSALIPKGPPLPNGSPTPKIVDNELLKKAYDTFKNGLKNVAGSSSAIGIAYSSLFNGGIVSQDSTENEKLQVWGNYQKSFSNNMNLLFIATGIFQEDKDANFKTGIALRAIGTYLDFSAELVANKQANWKLEPAGNLELKIIRQARAVLTLGTLRNENGEANLKFDATVKWNLVEAKNN